MQKICERNKKCVFGSKANVLVGRFQRRKKGKGAGPKTGLRLTEIWECLEEGTVLLRSIYHLTDVAICDRMCGISQCGLT